MKISLIIFTLLLSPVIGHSQEITVRSGEHGDYSRLVFDIPENLKWTITDRVDGVRIKFDRPNLIFDTSGVFERIGRNRIRDIRSFPDQSDFDIIYDCLCSVTSFLTNASMLVVDIGDGKNLALVREVDSFSQVQGSVLGPRAEAPSIYVDGVQFFKNRLEHLGLPDRKTRGDPNRIDFQIIEKVNNARRQGVLNGNAERAPIQINEVEQVIIGDRSKSSHEVAPGEHIGLSQIGNEMFNLSSEITQKRCDEVKDLNMADWISNIGNISNPMLEMFDELNRNSEKSIDGYAKALIAMGFGAESRRVLALNSKKQNFVLQSLSYIVDGEDDPNSYFDNIHNCNDSAILWTFLSQSEEISLQSNDIDIVIREFDKLPNSLRPHLGQRILEILSSTDFPYASVEILRRLQREGSNERSVIYEGAIYEVKEGRLDQASDILQPLINSSSYITPNALVLEIELLRKRGEAVSENLIKLSEAYLQEYHSTEIGSELWSANIIALGTNGRFREAFEKLQNVTGQPIRVVNSTRDNLFQMVEKSTENIDFLKYVVGFPKFDFKKLKGNTLLLVAKRLNSIGMQDATLELIKYRPDIQELRETKIIQASSLLSLRRPEEAEIALIGLTGNEVLSLKANARTMMGDHEYAKSIFLELNQEENALTSAWLTEDWSDISKSENTAKSKLATFLMSQEFHSVDEPNELRSVEILIQSSKDVESMVNDILKDTKLGVE